MYKLGYSPYSYFQDALVTQKYNHLLCERFVSFMSFQMVGHSFSNYKPTSMRSAVVLVDTFTIILIMKLNNVDMEKILSPILVFTFPF